MLALVKPRRPEAPVDIDAARRAIASGKAAAEFARETRYRAFAAHHTR